MKTRLLSTLMVAGLLALITPEPAAAAAMTPTSGPTAGKTLVTIYGGTGYSVATTVRMCGITVGATTVSADGSSITFVTPPCSAPGLYPVETFNPATVGLPGFSYVAVAPQPVSLTPASGPVSGGTVVTLRAPGQGPFVQGTTTASMCGAPAAGLFVVDSTTLMFTTPACGATGIATVATSNPATIGIPGFTYAAVGPVLTMVPTSGPITGGTTVQLVGAGGTFSLACTVLGFGAAPLAPTTVSPDGSRLTFVTPPGAAGSVAVTVGLAAGASAGACKGVGGSAGTFLYSGTGGGGVGAPYLAPTAGPAGTVITITNGVGFSVGTFITLCTSTSIPTTVAADGRSLTFLAPPCLLATPQTVTTSNPTYASVGTFTYGAAPPYTPPATGPYVYPPIVSLVTPSSGPVGGGNTVTVTGAYFQSGARVLFGTVASTSSVFINSTSLTAVVPAGTGNVAVTVLNPDGLSGQLTGAYTYTGAQGYTCVAGTAVGVAAMNATYSISTKVVKPNAYVTYRFSCTSAAAGQLITILGAQKNSAGAWSAFIPFTSRVADASGNALFHVRTASPSWWSFRSQVGAVYSNAVQSRWMN